VELPNPFRFVVYGDARFHDPQDKEPANPQARLALVQGIATANPQFVCFTGDLVYNGYDKNDWKIFDDETSAWRDKNLRVFPSIGNHELHGDQSVALANFFHRFPDLKQNRYYSVRAANALLLMLDSSMEEISGPQGEWLKDKFEHVPADVDFVFLVLHHPPYTSSTESKLLGGHSARPQEIALAKVLEQRQAGAPFRIVVFSGHVHNYERHQHGGVVYFVSGGGGAHPYPIDRHRDDLFQGQGVNYHYLTVDIDGKQMNVTMNRLDLTSTKAAWTQPDSLKINAANPAAQQVAGR
jgi:3',5'-cyclic AMP phosphodiesterase CpdA